MLGRTMDTMDAFYESMGDVFGRGMRTMLLGTILGLLFILIYLSLVILNIIIDPIGAIGVLIIGGSLTGGFCMIIWDRLLSHLWARSAPGAKILSLALVATTLIGEIDLSKVLLGGVALVFTVLYFEAVNKK